MSAKRSLSHKKVLITCGPTWVPIDDVRVISNHSTGRLSQLLALQLQRQGANVTLLEGAVERPLPAKNIRIIKFRFYDEFLALFKKELKKPYDIVIHAAAVADYKTRRSFKGKLSSNLPSLRIDLIPTVKIINLIKRLNPGTFLVGFKLEPALTIASGKRKAQKLFSEAGCDLVLVNSIRNGYNGFIVDKRTRILAQAATRTKIASSLIKTIKQALYKT